MMTNNEKMLHVNPEEYMNLAEKMIMAPIDEQFNKVRTYAEKLYEMGEEAAMACCGAMHNILLEKGVNNIPEGLFVYINNTCVPVNTLFMDNNEKVQFATDWAVKISKNVKNAGTGIAADEAADRQAFLTASAFDDEMMDLCMDKLNTIICTDYPDCPYTTVGENYIVNSDGSMTLLLDLRPLPEDEFANDDSETVYLV